MEFLEFSSDALFPTLSSDLLQQQIAMLENERPQEVENEDQASAPDNVSLIFRVNSHSLTYRSPIKQLSITYSSCLVGNS